MALHNRLLAPVLAVSLLTGAAGCSLITGEQHSAIPGVYEINPKELRGDLPDAVRDTESAVVRIVSTIDSGGGRYMRDGNAVRVSYPNEGGAADIHYVTTANTLMASPTERFASKCGSVAMVDYSGTLPTTITKAAEYAEIFVAGGDNIAWLRPVNVLPGSASKLGGEQNKTPREGAVLWAVSRHTPAETATPVTANKDVPLRIASLVFVGSNLATGDGYYIANGIAYEGVNPLDAASEQGAGIFYENGELAHLAVEQVPMSIGDLANATGNTFEHSGKKIENHKVFQVVKARYPDRNLVHHLEDHKSAFPTKAC